MCLELIGLDAYRLWVLIQHRVLAINLGQDELHRTLVHDGSLEIKRFWSIHESHLPVVEDWHSLPPNEATALGQKIWQGDDEASY